MYARRGVVGKCAFVTEKEQGWLCGTGCLKVTINSKIANSQYIFYQLQKAETIGWVEKHAVGATMPNLNTSILSDVPIELPSLDEQNRIVNVLKNYDNLISNNQKQIKLLEEAAQRLYKEWFVDLKFPGYEDCKIVDGVPEGWTKEKLIDLCEVQYGYAFDGSQFNDSGHGTPIIRIRNIPSGTTSDYTTEQAYEQYIVQNGEIVVGMDGEFHMCNWFGGKAYLNQRVAKLKPKDNKSYRNNVWLPNHILNREKGIVLSYNNLIIYTI